MLATHDRSLEFPRLIRRIALDSIYPLSKWTESRYRLGLSAEGSLPTKARTIPVRVSERPNHSTLEVYLGKAICMSTDYCDIARLRIRIAARNVLLHSKPRNVSITMQRRRNVIPRVTAIDGMFNDSETRRHSDCTNSCWN